jgi:hypothetical protein
MIKTGILISLFLITNKLFAITPEIHKSPQICYPTDVFTIAGSNADIKLLEIQSNMTMNGLLISKAVSDMALLVSGTQQKAVSDNSATMIELSQDKLKKDIEFKILMNEQELSMTLDQKSKEESSKKTVFFADDTAEEIKLITEFLKDNGDEYNVREISAMLITAYDDKPENKISIPFHGAKGKCSEEDIKGGLCSTQKSITPGRKLIAFFGECSKDKAKLKGMETEKSANNASTVNNARETQKAISTTDSKAAMAKRVVEQKDLSCNIEQYKNNLCLRDVSKEDYQLMVANNVIIRNANISPSNFLSPTKVGGVGTLVTSKEDLKILESQALDITELEINPMQDVSQVPIVNTYKNANQLKGALDFMNNIVGMDLVANQSPQERKDVSSLEFQSRYNNRIAVLSLTRSVFSDSHKSRIGRKLAEVYKNDPTLENQNLIEPVKESILGAGELDHLYARVDDLYKSVTVNGSDLKSIHAKEALNGQTGDKHWEKKNLENQKLLTEILFKRLMQSEKIELLKAAQVSSRANSVENIIYLKQLRNGS